MTHTAEIDADAWCNACLFGECSGCWSKDPDPWPVRAGERFECRCPHSVTPPEGVHTS